MGLFLLSLESGFFVLCSCQLDQCLISILLWYLSLSESGGKDKTMMMNMMTGAVAINGGVGVMEIRQPHQKKRSDSIIVAYCILIFADSRYILSIEFCS